MLLGVSGAVVAVVLLIRAGRSVAGADTAQGTVRVRAEVHTGVEQALIGLTRSLALVGSPADAAYGQLFLQQTAVATLTVGSRSEIGRGFRALITAEPGRGATEIRYAILRLPGDETLHAAVLQFELLLIEAIRRLDANADVRLVGRALRDLDRTTGQEGGAR
ncbi:hypothetical protein [Amnibacterium kyonggiense]|uniref:Polyketide cyclase/dehydrase/lipid transport protein n=1 Tax=Amnibacterium kyonggiense TaxID=595671 RepID=A0A4R7FR70_9MICO|nr:hypothetical protein [Amnibacterium kyonggiense]TDS80273.1 hypothetical protein CLV52_0829 [Amnibacterium kyonggiense]